MNSPVQTWAEEANLGRVSLMCDRAVASKTDQAKHVAGNAERPSDQNRHSFLSLAFLSRPSTWHIGVQLRLYLIFS